MKEFNSCRSLFWWSNASGSPPSYLFPSGGSFIPSSCFPKQPVKLFHIPPVQKWFFFFLHIVSGESTSGAATLPRVARHHLQAPREAKPPLWPFRWAANWGCAASSGQICSPTPHSSRGAGNNSCQSFLFQKSSWNLEVINHIWNTVEHSGWSKLWMNFQKKNASLRTDLPRCSVPEA